MAGLIPVRINDFCLISQPQMASSAPANLLSEASYHKQGGRKQRAQSKHPVARETMKADGCLIGQGVGSLNIESSPSFQRTAVKSLICFHSTSILLSPNCMQGTEDTDKTNKICPVLKGLHLMRLLVPWFNAHTPNHASSAEEIPVLSISHPLQQLGKKSVIT